MKKVIIRQIQLTNFKGVRSLTVDFTQNTSIYGRNASGKSTIFDAFTWLMFGKNAEGKKQFNIKTLNAEGKVIERLPHEVSAVIMVDDTECTLTRRYNEKWQKKRGEATEEFKGHEEERLFNDVPMSVRDWNDKISAICEEGVFRMVTNPLFFTSQKWESQRQMLIRMAGDVTDEDVCKIKPEFAVLIDHLNGKTLDEYKRELGAKKKRIKEEIDTLPARIEERRLVTSTPYDFNLAQARLHHKQSELEKLQASMNSGSSNSDKLIALSEKVADAKKAMTDYYDEIRRSIMKRVSETSTLKSELQGKKLHLQRLVDFGKRYDDDLNRLNEERTRLIGEWKAIKASKLEMPADGFICPTCGRELDPEQAEAKWSQMQEEFNKKKIADLQANQQKGTNLNVSRVDVATRIEENNEQIKAIEAKIAEMEEKLKEMPAELNDEQINDQIASDDKYNELSANYLQAEQDYKVAKESDNSQPSEEDKAKVEALKAEVAELNAQVAKKELYEDNEKRISELTDQLKNANEELGRLEAIEFDIQGFTKTRITMLEGKINSLFNIVKFKLFETQINGGEVEICTATVDGVPYADLNKAMQINAGLDIINAICESEGVSAPIFIDNAEAVNELLKTKSQTIRLVVSNDEKLKVINQ